MSILSSIKQSLRISADCTDFDDEINDLIFQAIEDLKASGIKPGAFNAYDGTTVDSIADYNIKQAIILYAKAFFGLENPDKQWFIDRYFHKKSELLNQRTLYNTGYIAGDIDV